MLGEEVVDRFRRGAMATRCLERERLEDRACCRAEVVVFGMLLALSMLRSLINLNTRKQ